MIAIAIVALLALLVIMACCKVSGDCAQEEEKENAQ